MTSTAPVRRHVSITVGTATLDIAGGADHTIASALTTHGIEFDDYRFVLLDADGTRILGTTTLADLDDGARVSVVDLAAPVVGPRAHRAQAGQRADHGVLWWMLAAAGAVTALTLIAVDIVGTGDVERGALIALAGVLLAGATASIFAVARTSSGSTPIAIAAATVLAFAAGAALAPASASHLSVTIVYALTTGALAMAALVAAARDAGVRAMASVIAAILLVFASVWAICLAFDWPAATAAAVSLGCVAPGLKLLPATLLNLPEGYSISYRHFMSQRWSVRGEVPGEPGPIVMATVSPALDASRSRLVAGTATLSAAAALFAPGVLLATDSASLYVRIGAWVALVSTVAVLALLPRSAPLASLRWTPRAAATIIAVEVGWFAARDAGDAMRLGGIAAAFVVALLAAALIVPLGRGTRSLSWSRVTDMVESIAAVIALPAALLAADMLELVRVAMAG